MSLPQYSPTPTAPSLDDGGRKPGAVPLNACRSGATKATAGSMRVIYRERSGEHCYGSSPSPFHTRFATNSVSIRTLDESSDRARAKTVGAQAKTVGGRMRRDMPDDLEGCWRLGRVRKRSLHRRHGVWEGRRPGRSTRHNHLRSQRARSHQGEATPGHQPPLSAWAAPPDSRGDSEAKSPWPRPRTSLLPGDRLHPAKCLLDPLADTLADGEVLRDIAFSCRSRFEKKSDA